MVKMRWACFMTGGYTEAGNLQEFLGRIDSQAEFRQCFPNKPKKSRKHGLIAPGINGLTGERFLQKVKEIILEHPEDYRNNYSGILLDDDLDGRMQGWEAADIEQHFHDVRRDVCSWVGKELPVVILYASPEIESWFYADWQNGFARLPYVQACAGEIPHGDADWFVHHLKKCLDHDVLGEAAEDIEMYAVNGADGIRRKLSDEIRWAVELGAFEQAKNERPDSLKDQERSERVKAYEIRYSKRIHGMRLLRAIRPEIVQKSCRHFFQRAYFEVKAATRDV